MKNRSDPEHASESSSIEAEAFEKAECTREYMSILRRIQTKIIGLATNASQQSNGKYTN